MAAAGAAAGEAAAASGSADPRPGWPPRPGGTSPSTRTCERATCSLPKDKTEEINAKDFEKACSTTNETELVTASPYYVSMTRDLAHVPET